MALRNPCFKDQSWSHLREEPVERERERERKKSKEEKKRKRKKMEEPRSSQQGMELLTLCMDPWFCWLMVYPKPRV